MPRSAVIANREAIEAALTDDERAILAATCEAFGVSLRGWHTLPMFRSFVLAAVVRMGAELVAGGLSLEDARTTAAIRCGVSPDSVRTWLRRAWRASRGREKKVQPEPDVA